jgi:hypothetical protein
LTLDCVRERFFSHSVCCGAQSGASDAISQPRERGMAFFFLWRRSGMRSIPAVVRGRIPWIVCPVSSFHKSSSAGTIYVFVTCAALRSVRCLGNCFERGVGCCSVNLDNG